MPHPRGPDRIMGGTNLRGAIKGDEPALRRLEEFAFLRDPYRLLSEVNIPKKAVNVTMRMVSVRLPHWTCWFFVGV